MTINNITKDAMYEAVAPDDFESMLNLDRYGARSPAFDKIIAATHDHFWNPLDKKYIDFDEPFDMENQALVPEELVAALQTKYVSDALSDPKTRIRFINQQTLRNFSSILHGEQGALEPLGLALPRALRPGRAGVRGQPDPRGSPPPRHRLRPVHQGPLGPVGGLQPGAAEPAGRDHRRSSNT